MTDPDNWPLRVGLLLPKTLVGPEATICAAKGNKQPDLKGQQPASQVTFPAEGNEPHEANLPRDEAQHLIGTFRPPPGLPPPPPSALS